MRKSTLTNMKIAQISSAAAAVLMGFAVNLFGFDSSPFFYALFLFNLLYVAFIVLRKGIRRFFGRYRTVLFIFAFLFLTIAAHPAYSDIYSLIRLMEVFLYMIALTVYEGHENMKRVRAACDSLFRVIIIITFFFTASSFILAIGGPLFASLGMRSFFTIPADAVVKWNSDLKQMTLGGAYMNGNQLGLCAFCSLMLSIYFLRRGRKHPAFDTANCVLQTAGIAAAGCRSIMITAAAAVILLMYLSRSPLAKRVVRIVILAALTGVIALSITKMRTITYEGSGFLHLVDRISGSRYEIWSECFRMFLKHPLLGVGLGNINSAAGQILGEEALIVTRGYTNAHNLFVNILTMTGLAGAFCFSLLGRDYVHGLKKTDPVLRILCLCFLIADQFDIFLIFTDKLPTLIMPLLAGWGLERQMREAKPFYFFSNLVEEDLYKELYTKKERPGQQAQKFNRLIAEGFADNGRKIECCTSVLASDAIVDYRFRRFENHGMYHYSLSINIPGIKTIWNILGAFFHTLYARYGAVIIDVLSIDNAIGALAAAKLRGMPDTGIVTDLPEHFSGDGLYAKIVYRIMAVCGSFVFLTEYMDEKLNPKHRPYIVMEGLCDSRVTPSVSSRRNNKIIFAGEIDEQNGVITLVRAFREWDSDEYELYYYGSGEAMDLLKKEAGGDPRIHIMGLILNRELLEIMKDAALLVNPRPIHQDFVKYSFPSKVMEYMNTGTLHASSHLACIPEEYFRYIGDLGDGSSEDILKYFRVFEKMPEKERDAMAAAAQKFVLENKNNRRQAERIAELLDGMYVL